MERFSHLDDFDFALRICRRQHPEVDTSSAVMAQSCHEGAYVELRDRSGVLLCSFSSSDISDHFDALVKKSQVSSVSADSSHSSSILSGFSEPQKAVRDTRSILGVISFTSLLLSGSLCIAGLSAAIVGFYGSTSGFWLALLFFFLAFVSHWSVRLMYIGLELLADIAEDIRSIRSSSNR